MTYRNVDLEGVSLGYRDTGTAGPPVLLLIHGLGASSATWERVVARYRDRLRIVALDLRGHGRSTWTSSYELPDMVSDVSRSLQALGIPRATVLGHSMGGLVALLFAARCPEQVERLILEEAPPPLPASPPRDEGAHPEGELDYDWNIQAPFSRQRNHPDPLWWDQLAGIGCPVTVIRGTDSHIGAGSVRRMVDVLADSNLIELAGGHDLHTECPEAFEGVLDEILADPH
ncbi:alpha/beta fold hydrolase [Kribbella sp. NBC_00709]|uniref:alpha/beta fold hydrolase n=1 Tax=Kribbella sp. NBC_00709 TaxID=2975972 RepID=UPI002E284181|nr:alpha/beta fold hydrolase [Kribbella sp. NBC_00709]